MKTKILIIGLAIMAQYSFAQWNLIWADWFDSGTRPNTAYWEHEIWAPGYTNNELQAYHNRWENSRIENKNLVIEARRDWYKSYQYSSARIRTKGRFSVKYGKIEASIKLTNFTGGWPAFWMLGNNLNTAQWPKCGEIDIMEHINTENTIYGSAHWDNGGHKMAQGHYNLDLTKYHIYTIEWDASYIKWFVDYNKYHEVKILNGVNSTQEFHQGFFILFNMAIGGNWPGFSVNNNALPARMYVDWVRVYQRTKNAVGQEVAYQPNAADNGKGGSVFSAYPNPTVNGMFMVVGLDENTPGVLQVSNANGQIVYSNKIEGLNNKEVDLSNFTSQGMYFVSYSNKYGAQTIKVIVK